MTGVVTVVGVGADGWSGMPAHARHEVEQAEVLVGGRRHLAVVPDTGAERVPWRAALREQLADLAGRHADRRLVVLASGDPLLSGVATTAVELLGAERVRVVPAVSSVALARARLGWSAESTDVVSLVGRDPAILRRHLSPGRRVIVLSGDGETPAAVGDLLSQAGYGASRMTVLSDLGGQDEAREERSASAWVGRDAPGLNVVCVECRALAGTPLRPTVPGLPDDAFEHDGQLTKRDLRASALARLAPVAGHLLWDVGAGAGSVAVEWMRTDPRCRAVAVEAQPARAARIGRNAVLLGVPGLHVVTGRAPDALAELPAPDAVFVGGGASRPGVLEACWAALRPGGRLVVHAVTLETEHLLHAWYRDRGGELTRLVVERAEPLGGFSGWSPARAVVQWAVTKEDTA
jgi:precorrin-6Y C5,15-methyltransferase (decarboxylating)